MSELQKKGEQRRLGLSVVRKVQVIAGATGALLTALAVGLIPVPFANEIDPHGAVSDFLFQAIMLTILPATLICDTLGIRQVPLWLGRSLTILINTLLCGAAGTAVGWVIQKCKERRQRPPPSAPPQA